MFDNRHPMIGSPKLSWQWDCLQGLGPPIFLPYLVTMWCHSQCHSWSKKVVETPVLFSDFQEVGRRGRAKRPYPPWSQLQGRLENVIFQLDRTYSVAKKGQHGGRRWVSGGLPAVFATGKNPDLNGYREYWSRCQRVGMLSKRRYVFFPQQLGIFFKFCQLVGINIFCPTEGTFLRLCLVQCGRYEVYMDDKQPSWQLGTHDKLLPGCG